jgi:DNA-binding FadR family transcriptional regulator
MSSCQKRGDYLGVSRADLEFHREICLASHDEIVITIWETLSGHMLIVFEQELMIDSNRSKIVEHHRTLRHLVERKKPKEISAKLERLIMRLRKVPALNKPKLKEVRLDC